MRFRIVVELGGNVDGAKTAENRQRRIDNALTTLREGWPSSDLSALFPARLQATMAR